MHMYSIDQQVYGAGLLVIHTTVLLNVHEHFTAAFGGKGELEALLREIVPFPPTVMNCESSESILRSVEWALQMVVQQVTPF